MTRAQTTEEFLQDIHNSQSPSWGLYHIQPSQSCAPSWWHFGLRVAFRLSEAFTNPRSSPPQGLPHSDTLSVQRRLFQSWSSNNRSSFSSVDSYVTASFPTFITCNVLSSRAFMNGDRFPGMQSQLISTSDHDHYNKSSMRTSCSYNNSLIRLYAIIHIRYILSFFSKERVASLTLRTHTTTLALFLC